MAKHFPLVMAAALVLACQPAYAALNRVWISGKGADQASCGTVAAPCRTLQYAHDMTNPGGEIDVLDGAGYGAITITKAISIVNDGVGVAGVLAPAGGNAVTISAGINETIILRGLTIEGSNVGVFGIEFNSGAGLSVSNSTIQGFTASSQVAPFRSGTGIIVHPQLTAGPFRFDIVNATIEGNTNGFSLSKYDAQGQSTARTYIAMDRVRVAGNASYGVYIDMDVSTPVVMTNSVISGNESGFYGNTGSNVIFDRCTVTYNTNGIRGSGSVLLSRSLIAGNGYGITDPVSSYGDNKLNQNRFNSSVNTYPTH